MARAAAGTAVAAFAPRPWRAQEVPAPVDAVPLPSSDYPPARMGMRGNHPGSFEAAHRQSWQGGANWSRPVTQTDSDYDLVVVGGGISGLAAAWFFREAAGADAKILVLDNHDDFGGHAKRNEFTVDGKSLVGCGGSVSLAPLEYLPEPSQTLLRAIDFDPDRLRAAYDKPFAERYLQAGIYFDAETYGTAKLAASPFDFMQKFMGIKTPADRAAMIAEFPVKDDTRASLTALFSAERDAIYPGLTEAQTFAKLGSQSYEDYLREQFGMTEEGIGVIRRVGQGATGVCWDSMPAIAAPWMEMPLPGLRAMSAESRAQLYSEPGDWLTIHLPSGNGGIARLLARDLVPGLHPGSTMESIADAHLDYAALDQPRNPVRVRLSSTAVDVRHVEDGEMVDVVYLRSDASGGGAGPRAKAERVRGRHIVLACWNHMVPHLCPEVGAKQRAALRYGEKMPVVFTNVALRNWKAIADSGFGQVYAPRGFHSELSLGYPARVGDRYYPEKPEQPVVLQLWKFYAVPGAGMNAREQFRVSRHELFSQTLADFEQAVFDQLGAVWGPFGMDPKKDVAGITVNRWGHGYAYVYNSLFDDPAWNDDNGPHIRGRARLGRISIANSDSGVRASASGAILQGHRAVQEQLGV